MSTLLELELDGIAHGGEALGRHGGKVIFVPYAIPGERVKVELIEEKPRWARARLLDVLSPSSDRIGSPCPYFGQGLCSGCQWQHIAYHRQAALKEEIVADQLRRLGGLANPPLTDILVMAREEAAEGSALLTFGYRNQIRFAMTTNGMPGFHRAASVDVMAVDHCMLLDGRLDDLHAALDVAWPTLKGISLHAGTNTGQALVVFEAETDEPPELEIDLPAACAMKTPLGIHPLIGQPWLEEAIAGRCYRISAGSFFRENTTGAEALVEVVAAYLEPRGNDVLLDAYCGVGLFGLAFSEAVASVVGVEPSTAACEDFAVNAGSLDNIALHEGAVADVLPALRAHISRVDLSVMSPPRSGAGRDAILELGLLGPRRIVYVACDPASLARDYAHLRDAGYRLTEAQPLDLFPQTSRVETVALLERTRSG